MTKEERRCQQLMINRAYENGFKAGFEKGYDAGFTNALDLLAKRFADENIEGFKKIKEADNFTPNNEVG